MKERVKIGVLRGGYSGEDVISHQSAATMMGAIDLQRFDPYMITLDRNGWNCQDANGAIMEFDPASFRVGPERSSSIGAVLIAIHGPPGENGRLQGFLDIAGVRYQTGDVLNMALTFSKSATTRMLDKMGHRVCKSLIFRRSDMVHAEGIATELGLPCFVKPDQSGSSLGISKVKRTEDLQPAIELAFKESELVMVEEAASGKELTCGVVRLDGEVVALPICEIRTTREFFDFEAKYHDKGTEEIVPAPVPEDVTKLCQERSAAIYRDLDCRGMVRVDHFWNGKELITIEVNTTPGFSSASIFPKMISASGRSISQVINMLIDDMLIPVAP